VLSRRSVFLADVLPCERPELIPTFIGGSGAGVPRWRASPPKALPCGTVRAWLGSLFGQDLRESCPEKRPIVRSAASLRRGLGAAELFRVVGFEESDQQPVGVFALERDEFASVVDRLGDSVDGDLPGLLFEAESVLLLNGGEGLPVGFRDAHRVVVQLVGNAGLLGGDPDDAVGPEGVEERFLEFREWFGHGWGSCLGCGPMSYAVQSAREVSGCRA